MSNINSIWPTVKLGGKTYSLICNLNVIESIQDRYGEFDKIADALTERSIKEYKWLLMTFINEDIYLRRKNGEDLAELTERDIGTLIDISQINQESINGLIRAAVIAAFPQRKNPLSKLKEVVRSISRGTFSQEERS